MTSPSQATSPPVSLARALRVPLATLILLGLIVLCLWLFTPQVDQAILPMGISGACVLGILVLSLWLFIGKMPGWLRLVGAAAVAIPVAGFCAYYEVEDIRFSGGMWPQLRPRFSRNHERELEEHRKDAVSTPVPANVLLTGKLPTDFAEYRGAKRDGIVHGPALSTKPPKLLWKQPVGGGHSAFAVADRTLYTLEQRRGDEVVACYDAESGKQLWVYAYPALFDERLGDKGPRSTPTVVDGTVYAFGATGIVTALDARTGKPRWQPVNLLEDNEPPTWGMAGSPLVVGDLLLINAGKQLDTAKYGTLVALDRHTGKVLWSVGSAPAGYSSPQLATLAGKQVVLLFDGKGLGGYDLAEKGKELFRVRWDTQQNINVAQPLVLEGDRVLISSAYGRGACMLQITVKDNAWKATEIWKSRDLRCKFASPVYFQGYLYGLDDGTLHCVDAKTGDLVWKGTQYNHGQILLSGNTLVILGERGLLALVEATPTEFKELMQYQALEPRRTWNPHALSDGRLYIRNNVEMAAYDLRGQ